MRKLFFLTIFSFLNTFQEPNITLMFVGGFFSLKVIKKYFIISYFYICVLKKM